MGFYDNYFQAHDVPFKGVYPLTRVKTVFSFILVFCLACLLNTHVLGSKSLISSHPGNVGTTEVLGAAYGKSGKSAEFGIRQAWVRISALWSPVSQSNKYSRIHCVVLLN